MRQKYARLSNEIKDTLKELTLEGKSLNDISKLTGLGETTIYYQVKSLKPRQWRKMEINLSEFEIGELIGAFAGDGNYYHKDYGSGIKGNKDYESGIKGNKDCRYRIRYFLSLKSDQEYADYLTNLLKNLNLNPGRYIREKDNTICVDISSKSFIELIKRYLKWDEDKTFTIRLKDDLNFYSEDFLKGFARGLMDTDGSINESNAVCACISKRLIDNLGEIFNKFQIIHSRSSLIRGGNTRELFYARVLKAGLFNYQRDIGFSNKYKEEKLYQNLKKWGYPDLNRGREFPKLEG